MYDTTYLLLLAVVVLNHPYFRIYLCFVSCVSRKNGFLDIKVPHGHHSENSL